jgi:hypothetical protein
MDKFHPALTRNGRTYGWIPSGDTVYLAIDLGVIGNPWEELDLWIPLEHMSAREAQDPIGETKLYLAVEFDRAVNDSLRSLIYGLTTLRWQAPGLMQLEMALDDPARKLAEAQGLLDAAD